MLRSSVLADESVEISGTQQRSICIRYVSDKDTRTEIREDFLGFCLLSKQYAANISHTILRQLTEMGLEVNLQFTQELGLQWSLHNEWTNEWGPSQNPGAVLKGSVHPL